jgi:glyoxylase-like metal-dependent hydrolase (beta-lactamase superfamily II)/8-oxo-dGTP pyrophosphatase MutT (NUDIX family)
VTEADRTPRPAATVVLLRGGRDGPEVLLTQRPASMAFAGDLHVFPGGRVDAGDADPRAVQRSAVSPAEAATALGGDLEPAIALAAYVAALRELFEEAGVLLAEPQPAPGRLEAARRALLGGEVTIGVVADELDLRLRTDLLAPIGHWTTPPIMPRRFDTRFFAAELPDGAEPSFEVDEVIAHRWATPRAALDAMAAGEIGMWVPTSATLQQLEFVTDLAEIRRRIVPSRVAAPRVVAERPGITRIVVSGAGAVPGQTVNSYLVGRRRLVLVDPGDPSDAAAAAYLAAAAETGGEIVAVALTHVDPDHAGGAEGMALRLEIPIHVGPGGGRDLPYPVRELADGQSLTDGDLELLSIATPGPRSDHLAFAVDGDLLVGDLVGGRADQAVLRPVDEAASTASLDRLAARRPARLFPGHGEPFGPEALRVRLEAMPPGSEGS